jgi:type-F conjugative transfer system pilin assembly protein TrbC
MARTSVIAACAAASLTIGLAAVAQPTVPIGQPQQRGAPIVSPTGPATVPATVMPTVPPMALNPQRNAGAIDLSTLAQQYERLRLGPAAGAAGAGDAERDREARGLVVFVSLGMPAASLDRLIADAERLRAPLVLRGITGGSIKATAERIERLNAGRKVGWQIDPAMFKRFDVRAVPAFVLIDPARPVTVDCPAAAGAPGLAPQAARGAQAAQGAAGAGPGASCKVTAGDDATAFSKVTGDVSFGHALAEMERADPPFAALARRYAARLAARGSAPGGGR